MDVGTAVGYLDLDTNKFTSGLKTAQQQLQGFTDKSNSAGDRIGSLGGALKTAGSSMTKTFTVPILGAGIAAGKMAMDTDESMSKVNSILQLGGKEFTAYEKTLKKGANEIGLAYADYADAAYDAISAGVEQGKVTEFLTGANKLAKGGLTDLTNATNLLTTVQNAYGLEQKDLAHVSDVLIQTQNKGKVTVDELASSMGKIIPTAKGLGVNMDQLGAGYAIMTAKGIASAEATTYMNSMFGELGKSGTKVSDTLKEISGKSFKELMDSGMSTGDVLQMLSDHADKSGLSLTDLFGSAEAGKAAMTLLSDGSAEFNDMLATMGDSAGATDKAFNEMNNTTKEKLTQSFNTLKNALAELGAAMLPIIEFVAQIVSRFSEFITRLAETNPGVLNFIVALLGILAVVGPILMGIGQFILMIGSLITFFSAGGVGAGLLAGAFTFLTGPIGIAIAIIGALIAIGVLLYNNWELIKAKCTEVWNTIVTTVSTVWNNISTTTMSIWSAILGFLSGIWQGIWGFISPIVNFIGSLISSTWSFISGITSSIWNSIKGIIQSVWELIKSIINLGIAVIKLAISTAWNTIKTVTSTVWNAIKSVISTVWNAIKPVVTAGANAVKSVVTTVFNAVKNVVTTVWNAIKSAIDIAWQRIKSVVTKGANLVKSTVSTVFGTIERILTAPFKAAQKVISGILGGISRAINKVTGAIKKATKSMPEPPQPQPQDSQPDPKVHTDDTDYSKVGFNYFRAKQTNMSDSIAKNQSLVQGVRNFANDIKETKVSSSKNSDGITRKSINLVKEIVVPVILDGKEIARVIAPYSDIENGERIDLTERGLNL